MCRSSRLFLALLVVAWLSPALPGTASAGELNEVDELLKASGSPGTDAAKVEALIKLLREAERQQAQNRSSAQRGHGATSREDKDAGAATAPEAAAADAPEASAAGEEAGEQPEAEDETPKSVARAGCMYSGKTLIWEKVPGACAR